MSSTGTENYSRIMLTLMKGGTKLTRGLVEKRVKDLSKNGEEDTIDEFLLKNKVLISQQKMGKNKQDVFFPPSGHTNLDYWDLCMFCFILEETCDLSNTAKMRIRQLLKIRNKLCHISDPTLEKIKFEDYTDKLKRIFENFLEEINDKKFTEEINALVQSFATGPLSIDDTLKAVHKLYHLEWTHREVLEKIGNGQDLTNGKLDTLIEKVERLDSRLPSTASVDIPGIGIVIEVKNCSAEKKKEVLDILEKNFNEAIEQKVSCLEEGLPNGVLHTLRETVAQVFEEFFQMGRCITFVEQKCLMLTIKCTSVSSFVKMIRDYRTGDLTLQLSTIETAIKNLHGCDNVQLENLIFKEEFMEVMDDLVSKLCERVQQTEHTVVQTSSNAENSIRVTFKFPTLSERVTVQNRFETKMFGKGMKRIESELRRKLNVESVSLTAKLVKDDAVSNFAYQSDTSAMDGNTTVEEESESRQPRRKAALSEEEVTTNPSLRRDSQLISDKSTLIFQGPVVKTTGKVTQASFNEGDMQIVKHTRVTNPLWTKMKDETETRQSRRKAEYFEEEDASTPSLRRNSQLISDNSTYFFQGPVVKTKDKEIRISFDDMQIRKKTRYLTDKLQELSRNINDLSTKFEIDTLTRKAEGVCNCATKAFTVTGKDVLQEKKKLSRVSCPNRVDTERLSQTILAFQGDLRTCRNKLLSMRSSINNFIHVNRCTIKVKEEERIAASFEVDKHHLLETEISKYVDKAHNKYLRKQAHDLRRKAKTRRMVFWGTTTSVCAGLMLTGGRTLGPFAAGLFLAGITMVAMNLFKEPTVQDIRELDQRKRKSTAGEYKSKTIELRNSKASIGFRERISSNSITRQFLSTLKRGIPGISRGTSRRNT